MKQFFIALVFMNLGYLLLQGVSVRGAGGETAAQSTAVAPGVARLAMSFVPAAPNSATAHLATSPLTAIATEPGIELAALPASASAALSGNSPANESAASPARCVIAGPYRSKSGADALVKKLANEEVGATRQPRDSALLPDFMVYVGPHGSYPEAQALVAGFKVRKMDSHIINSGALRHSVSLGVFSQGPLAQSLHQQLETEGYNVNIAKITRNRRGYQVRATLPQLIRSRMVKADTAMVDCPAELATTVVEVS